MEHKEIEMLIDALSSLPSISKKTAEKITYFLINQDDVYINQLIGRISDLKTNTRLCKYCNDVTSNSDYCKRCTNPKLNRKELVIVTNFLDVEKLEKILDTDPLFFILLSEINFKKRDTRSVDERYVQLKEMIEKFGIEEILLATDLTINGELTANYLVGLIKRDFDNIKIYRPATGMPLNSSIDYIDIDSLKYSIKNKTKM